MITLNSVNKTYRQGNKIIHALKDISLEIPEGSFVSIIGKSGSGKSTLLKFLALIEPADDGTYLLDGQVTTSLKDRDIAKLRNRKISLITQTPSLIETSDVTFNVLLPLYLRGKRVDAAVRDQLAQCLSKLGIDRYAKSRVSQLSGGERQRVCIARAMLSGSDYILADEPTGALDSTTGKLIMQELINLKRMGRCIIMVSHDLEFAGFAEIQYAMSDGVISRLK